MPKSFSNGLPDKSLAFHLYMLEYKQQILTNGRILSYDELRTEIIPRWNHLPKSKREEYKKKAIFKKDEIEDKIQQIHNRDVREANLKREEANAKKQLIKEYLDKKTKDNYWKKENTFIVADFNIFVKTKEDVYPAEMAMSKFKLNDGIIDTLHLHIELEGSTAFPQGLLNTAKMTSEDTHQIPLPPDNRKGFLTKISLEDAKRLVSAFLADETIVFALQEMLLKHDVLDVIERSFAKCFDIKITAAPLGDLMKALKNQERYYVMNVDKMLIDNPLETCASIGCKHHFEVDAPKFCSLARVKRWVYQLIKLVLPHEKKDGNQVPDFNQQPDENQLIFGFCQKPAEASIPRVLSEISNINNENAYWKSENVGYKKDEKSVDNSEPLVPQVMPRKRLNYDDGNIEDEQRSKVRACQEENAQGNYPNVREVQTPSDNFQEDSFDDFSEADLSEYMVDDDVGSDDTLTEQNFDATITEQQLQEIDNVLALGENFSSLDLSYFTDDVDIEEYADDASTIMSYNSQAFTDNFSDCSTVIDENENNYEEYSEYDFDELLA